MSDNKLAEIARNGSFDHARSGCSILATGHSVANGRYYGLLVVNAAVLSSITARGNNVDDINRLVGGDPLPAGTYIPVELSGAAVTSGRVVLFKEPS